IDEHQDQLQLFSIPQITFGHSPPGFLYCLWNLGVPVAWQIHKVRPIIDQKEVDHLRPARRGTRASQTSGIRKSVQQAGFANIRSATKSDFWSLISGKIIRSYCALDE